MTGQCFGYLVSLLACITALSAVHPHIAKPQCAPGAKIPGIICEAGVTRLKCPPGFQCLIDPSIQLGFCCRQDSEQPPPPETGPTSLTTPEPENEIPAGQGHKNNQGKQYIVSAPEGVVGWKGTTQPPQGAPEISDLLDPERDGAPQTPATKRNTGQSQATKQANNPQQANPSGTLINYNQAPNKKPTVILDPSDLLDPERDGAPPTTTVKPKPGTSRKQVKKSPKSQQDIPVLQKKIPKQKKASSNAPKAGTQPEPATAESTKQAQTSTGYQQGLPKVSKTTQVEVMAGHKQVSNSYVKQSAIPSKPKSAKPHRTGSSTTETSIQVPCENPVRDGNGKFTMCSRRSACSSPCQFCGQLRNFQIPIGICCQRNNAVCSRSSTSWTMILSDPVGGAERLHKAIPHQIIDRISARSQMSTNQLGAPTAPRAGIISAPKQSGELRRSSLESISGRNSGSLSLLPRNNVDFRPMTSIQSQNRNGQQGNLGRYPYPQSMPSQSRQDPMSDFTYPMMLYIL